MEFLIGVILFPNTSVCQSIGTFDHPAFLCITTHTYFKISFM